MRKLLLLAIAVLGMSNAQAQVKGINTITINHVIIPGTTTGTIQYDVNNYSFTGIVTKDFVDLFELTDGGYIYKSNLASPVGKDILPLVLNNKILQPGTFVRVTVRDGQVTDVIDINASKPVDMLALVKFAYFAGFEPRPLNEVAPIPMNIIDILKLNAFTRVTRSLDDISKMLYKCDPFAIGSYDTCVYSKEKALEIVKENNWLTKEQAALYTFDTEGLEQKPTLIVEGVRFTQEEYDAYFN